MFLEPWCSSTTMRPGFALRHSGFSISGPVRNVVNQHIRSRTAHGHDVNAPRTLPLRIDLSNQPHLSRFQNLLKKGKSIVKLYKEGIINVWKNIQESREIKKRFGVKGVEGLTQRIVNNARLQDIQCKGQELTALPEHIKRSEYITLLRTSKDAQKLPVFAVVFAVCFEFTPLVVLLFPGIVPRTCVLPSQATKHMRAMNSRIADAQSLVGGTLVPFSSEQVGGDMKIKVASLSAYRLNDKQIKALGDIFFNTRFLTRNAIISRLQWHVEYIRADNALLGRFGSVWALDDHELILACLDRAITTTGKAPEQLRAELLHWIAEFDGLNYDCGYLLCTPPDTPKAMMPLLESA